MTVQEVAITLSIAGIVAAIWRGWDTFSRRDAAKGKEIENLEKSLSEHKKNSKAELDKLERRFKEFETKIDDKLEEILSTVQTNVTTTVRLEEALKHKT